MLHVVESKTREEWAVTITEDWRNSIENILQAGRDLIQAKAQLPHGEFEAMVQTDLPFGERTARALMSVARHPGISNRKSISDLPPSWAVLSELARLTEEQFDSCCEEGKIHPGLTRRDARKLVIDERPEEYAKPPAVARKIAEETGLPQVGSDGNIHFGVERDEVLQAKEARDMTYTVIDAVNALAAMPSVEDWVASLERWRTRELDPEKIAVASEWLRKLTPLVKGLKNGQ